MTIVEIDIAPPVTPNMSHLNNRYVGHFYSDLATYMW